jgi:hypothetical protein
MSNKRIDLTQFESEKEWDLTGFDWLAKQADSEYVANAVRQTPTLIAELKKCYEEIDALRSITQDWVKIETFTDDGKDLSVDMEDSDGNCFSGYINRASE